MNRLREQDTSGTVVDVTSFQTSQSTALAERRQTSQIHPQLNLYGSIFLALAFTIPTTANVRIAGYDVGGNTTFADLAGRFRRRDHIFEIAAYAPFITQDFDDIGPLKIQVGRTVRARINFVGQLRMLPLRDEL